MNYIPNGYYPTNYFHNMQPVNNKSIIWVQGREGAKAYPVSPGDSVVLMDSEVKCE